MKFVHIADMHFDTSFTQLSNSENLGNLRRLEQKKVFKKVIEYIKNNNIEYFFIAGDLYEHNYIRESTIEYINSLFKEIPNTKVFITPGNHDPYLKNSFYNKFRWNDNVHIFGPNISVVNCGDVNIYGFGFNDFYYTNSELDSFELNNKNAINILITHATLNGTNNVEKQYNAIQKYTLDRIGFDYVALGHIHKNNYTPTERIVYPGSTVSIGFDEPGKHGMVYGEITKESFKTEFVPLDETEFKVESVDISNLNAMDELAEYLNELQTNEMDYYEIYLIGNKNFETDMYNLKKMINQKNIIKIKDLSKMGYDIEAISKENNLKGLFVKELLNQMKENPENKKIIEEALEIGLEILEK